jgi:hypothetical protein
METNLCLSTRVLQNNVACAYAPVHTNTTEPHIPFNFIFSPSLSSHEGICTVSKKYKRTRVWCRFALNK